MKTDIQQGETTAILNCRIRRQPASLANYHYHIEPGKMLYVVDRMDHRSIVSTVPRNHRCSEDIFYIPTKYLVFASNPTRQDSTTVQTFNEKEEHEKDLEHESRQDYATWERDGDTGSDQQGE